MIQRLLLLFLLGCFPSQLIAQQHVLRTIRLSDELWQGELYVKLNVEGITSRSQQISRGNPKPGIVQHYQVNSFGAMSLDSVDGEAGWTHRLYYDFNKKLTKEYYANPYDTTETHFFYQRNVLLAREEVTVVGAKDVLHTFRYEYNNYAKMTQWLKTKGTDGIDTLLLVTYKYDEQKRISERVTQNYEKGYLYQSTDLFDYDDINHYMMIETKMLSETMSSKALAYDGNGRLLEYINVRRKLRIVLKYDEQGLLMRKRYFQMPKNLLVGEKEYSYQFR
jgi:hypothetical protein